MTTSSITPPDRPDWVRHVEAAAQAFGNRVASDFRLSLQETLRHLPDPKNQAQRSQQLNEFFNVISIVAPQLVAQYGGPAAQLEELFVKIVHDTFARWRADQAKAAEANATKPATAPALVKQ